MRITFVLPDAGLSGGVRVVTIYAAKLRARGHQVTIVSACPRPKPMKSRLKSWVGGNGWPPRVPPASAYFDDLDVDHRLLTQHRPIRAQDCPDAEAIVATWWETAEWIADFPASKGEKFYFIQHDERFIAPQHADRIAATWRMPMHQITICGWLVDIAKREFASDDIVLIPNSVDSDQFDAPPRARQTHPTLGTLFSRVPFKGCDVTFRAIAAARARLPRLDVVCFGSQWPLDDLPLPPETEFHHKPRQEQIRTVYAKCDFWICGSRAEGFGLPILESMACRCPVISTRVGAAFDLVTDGVNGRLVDIEDADAMTEAIVELVGLDDKTWSDYSRVSYERAHAYTWDDAADLFERAIAKRVGR